MCHGDTYGVYLLTKDWVLFAHFVQNRSYCNVHNTNSTSNRGTRGAPPHKACLRVSFDNLWAIRALSPLFIHRRIMRGKLSFALWPSHCWTNDSIQGLADLETGQQFAIDHLSGWFSDVKQRGHGSELDTEFRFTGSCVCQNVEQCYRRLVIGDNFSTV